MVSILPQMKADKQIICDRFNDSPVKIVGQFGRAVPERLDYRPLDEYDWLRPPSLFDAHDPVT